MQQWTIEPLPARVLLDVDSLMRLRFAIKHFQQMHYWKGQTANDASD
jgi:phenylalanine-4-hydroxylase